MKGAAAFVNPLSGFVLVDEYGRKVALDDLWRERAAAPVFLRHYLCVQCPVGAMELERDRHLLELNLRRGNLLEVFGLAAQRVARRRAKGVGLTRAAAGGNRPKKRPEQDWHQLGGAFVFAPGGTLVWAHRAQHAGDDAGAGTLAEELGRGRRPAKCLTTPTQIPAMGRKKV